MRALNIPRSQSSVKCFVAATPALSPRLFSGYRESPFYCRGYSTSGLTHSDIQNVWGKSGNWGLGTQDLIQTWNLGLRLVN